MEKYYDIHVYHDRKNAFSIPFKTNVESESEIVNEATKAGKLDLEDANCVDYVDEIYKEDYLAMGGNEDEDNQLIEDNKIDLQKTMDKCRDENF